MNGVNRPTTGVSIGSVRLHRTQHTQSNHTIRFGEEGDQAKFSQGEILGMPSKAEFEKQLNRYKKDLSKSFSLKRSLLSIAKLPVSLTGATLAYPIAVIASGGILLHPKAAFQYFTHTNQMLDSIISERRDNKIFDLTFSKPGELLREGKAKEAFAQFEKALDKKPLDPWTYSKLGDFARDIIADLKGIINRGYYPNFNLSEEAKGTLKGAGIDYKGTALEAYNRAEQIWQVQKSDKSIPSYATRGDYIAWNLASLYDVLEDKAKTIEYREQAVEAERKANSPMLSTAIHFLIHTYDKYGEPEKAMKLAKEIALEGDFSWYANLFRQQAEKEAGETNKEQAGKMADLNALEALLQEKPDNKELITHLANRYQFEKQPEKALEKYQQLLNLELDSPHPHGGEIKRLNRIINKLRSNNKED